jgi:citrate synthase
MSAEQKDANGQGASHDPTTKVATKFWYERPTEHNPYVADQYLCHGYDLLELASKRSFVEVLYLIFKGELPTLEQVKILETLMILLINPGPRHPATRAAMNAAVGKVNTAHLLPIGLSILSGEHLGGGEVGASMEFMKRHRTKSPQAVAAELLAKAALPKEGDCTLVPGFGSRFGDRDVMAEKIAAVMMALPGAGKTLCWGSEFAVALNPAGLGWLVPGVAAAVFLDLGFHPRAGAGMFQLISAPGILAHGLEFANKPLTAIPWMDDDHYVIEALPAED